MKYKLLDIKHRISQFENSNIDEHKNYLTATIDKTISEPFPSWIKITKGSIADCAFYECRNITSIVIPESVTSIGMMAFSSNISLTDIYMHPITPPILESRNSIYTTTTIHVPVGSGDAYKSATNWSSFADVIVEDIVIE